MGQWSQGGMIMVGDMFNNALKARVDALCTELAGAAARGAVRPAPVAPVAVPVAGPGGPGVSLFVSGGAGGAWWPAGSARRPRPARRTTCATPSSRRPAASPSTSAAASAVYDTGDHLISGVSQQQSGDRSLTFTSQHGPVRIDELRRVPAEAGAADPASPAPRRPCGADAPPPAGAADILATIERLHELRRKDILSEAEFATKKAELLSRL